MELHENVEERTAMKPIKRIVSTSFWEDEKVVETFSPEDKYFYLYLLTNPHTTQLGVYRLVPKTAAFELGYSKEAVCVLIDRFEKKYGLIKFSRETSEVAIKNYLRHSIVKGGKPVMDCLLKEESSIEDKSLLVYIYNNINNKENINNTVKEYLEHIKIYINDNDNERYVHESYHESYHDSSPSRELKKFNPPSVAEVDEYCLRNNLEYVNPNSFVEFYGSKNWMVGKNKMSNWHMAVSGWNTRSRDRGERKYVRQQIVMPKPIEVHTDRPERWRSCPDSTWSKLRPYAHDDGTFDWSTFDASVLTGEDLAWMRNNGM